MKLSIVVLAKNEQRNIIRAIESVEFSDEIIVIDDFSTDKTSEYAMEMGAVVHRKKLNNNFASQRNFGLQKSRGDWILFLDADEFLTKELQTEIKKLIKGKSKYSVYHIKRRDFMWGKELEYGEIKTVRKKGLIRLVKKGSGKWISPVHEVFVTTSPAGRLNNFINHYPHPTVKEFLDKINFYSTLRAKELFHLKKNVSLLEIIFFPTGKFLMNYFIKLGFLDGPAGFLYAFMMSFHSFLVRAKLYQYLKLDQPIDS